MATNDLGLKAEIALHALGLADHVVHNDRNNEPSLTGAASSARAVDVVLWSLWQVVVDNTGQGVNVNTTSGHIGSDENIGATRDNGGQCFLTLGLGAVTVNGNGFDTALFELVGQTVSTVLGLAKDDGTAVLAHE